MPAGVFCYIFMRISRIEGKTKFAVNYESKSFV